MNDLQNRFGVRGWIASRNLIRGLWSEGGITESGGMEENNVCSEFR